MILPRQRLPENEADACPSGHVFCSPSGSGSVDIVGSDSGDGAYINNNTTPTHISGPGPHRFIGIAMVGVMICVVFAGWLYYARRSKPDQDESESPPEKPKRSWLFWRTKPHPVTLAGEAYAAKPKTPTVSEKERSMMLQSEPRGLIKEVSGGVVVFTEPPRPALPSRERYPAGDWALEHVHGVRFEARTPPPRRHPGKKPKPSSRNGA